MAGASWRNPQGDEMSADKHRSLARRLRLLREAQEHPLLVNWEDGIGSGNRDLQRLVAEGLIRLERYRRPGDFRFPPPKRFRKSLLGPSEDIAPRTHGVITKSGGACLAANSRSLTQSAAFAAPSRTETLPNEQGRSLTLSPSRAETPRASRR